MYYSTDFVSIDWNEEVNVAIMTWKKFAEGENFRTPCNKALDLAISKKTNKWFSDTTNAGVFIDEDINWFNSVIVKRMLENGINKSALIVPKSIITQMSLKKAAIQAQEIGLEIKYFASVDEALNWLKSL